MGKREVTIDVLLILAEFFGIAQRTNVKTGANANPVLSGILRSPQINLEFGFVSQAVYCYVSVQDIVNYVQEERHSCIWPRW